MHGADRGGKQLRAGHATQPLWPAPTPVEICAYLAVGCCAGSCSPSEQYATLWELPLWAVMDANLSPIASMDPPGDAYENFKREVSWAGLVAAAVRGSRDAASARKAGTQLGGARLFLVCPACHLQLDWRLAGNRAPLGLFFHAGEGAVALMLSLQHSFALPCVLNVALHS